MPSLIYAVSAYRPRRSHPAKVSRGFFVSFFIFLVLLPPQPFFCALLTGFSCVLDGMRLDTPPARCRGTPFPSVPQSAAKRCIPQALFPPPIFWIAVVQLPYGVPFCIFPPKGDGAPSDVRSRTTSFDAPPPPINSCVWPVL